MNNIHVMSIISVSTILWHDVITVNNSYNINNII